MALIQKAYETGHISHRADGDWQKTNNGWVRVKGSPAKSTFKEPDQITLPNARKLTSDEIQELQQISDINERKKRQAEMLSQSAPAEEYGEITEEDLVETSDSSGKDSSYSEYLSNQDAIESYVDELDFDPDITLDQTNREDVEAYLEDHDWDSNFHQYLEEQGFDVDSIDEDSDEYQNALNDFMNKAVTYLSDNWDYRTEADQQYEDYVKDDMESVINNYGDKTAEEALNSWMEDYGFEDLSEDNRKDFIEQFNKKIQKSAVRDMRSTPATKNMGF